MLVLGFPENLKQAELLSRALECELAEVRIHRFPDGESLVTLPEQLPDTVVVFRSLYDPNTKLIELFFALKAARSLGSRRVILVSPYLCYMRQDKAFEPGQAVSQRILAEWLGACVDDLITVDPHLHRIGDLSEVFTRCKTRALSAAPLLGRFIRDGNIDGVLVAPDAEARQWVEQVAAASGLDYVVAGKQRISDLEVRITLPAYDYRGRPALIVDDVISSGKTVVEAALQLATRGAADIRVFCTHALFAGGAEEAMSDAGIRQLVSANTIPHPSNRIDLSSLIAEAVGDGHGISASSRGR